MYCVANDIFWHFKTSALASSTGERGCLECGTGDKMGCGIVFNPVCELSHRVPQLVLIYFTKNGSIIYRKIRWLPAGGFYPTVGLFAVGVYIIPMFDLQKFCY